MRLLREAMDFSEMSTGEHWVVTLQRQQWCARSLETYVHRWGHIARARREQFARIMEVFDTLDRPQKCRLIVHTMQVIASAPDTGGEHDDIRAILRKHGLDTAPKMLG